MVDMNWPVDDRTPEDFAAEQAQWEFDMMREEYASYIERLANEMEVDEDGGDDWEGEW